MNRLLARFFVAGIAVTTLACAGHARSTPVPGEYARSTIRLREDGQVLPVPNDGPFAADFPSAVRLDNANGFVVESSNAQLNGHYRLERDSIFLDQDTDSGARLAFAGRATGDTLDVHWISASGQRSNAAGADVELVFVRSK
ncbi:MAG TPA: hypothetical protein VJO33_07860 [Gemmatimonadaceae bacterium]|nr:hypothetical protein [Gemmatimonadaceae bacterium]